MYHLSPRSSNSKTGPIPVSTSEDSTCWKGCGLFDVCYGKGYRLKAHWDKVSQGIRGVYWETFLLLIMALAPGILWRHNQSGDLPGKGARINGHMLRQLVSANKGKRGFTYTHKPVLGDSHAAIFNRQHIRHANNNGFTINLSGNGLDHADQLKALNIAPVVTVLSSDYARRKEHGAWIESVKEYKTRLKALPVATPQGAPIIVCPATCLDSVTCKTCGLCQIARAPNDSAIWRRFLLGFPVHGIFKSRANKLVAA